MTIGWLVPTLNLLRMGAGNPLVPPPPPPVVYPSESRPFAQIASTIRARLASITGIDQAYIRPVANESYDLNVTEDFFLYYQFFDIESFGDSGGGRRNPWAYRTLRVYVYTRQGVDTYGEDEVALIGDPNDVTNSTPPLGQFKAEELVLSALFNWMPVDESNVALCTEPLHPMKGQRPPLRKSENSEGLLRSTLDFQIRYGLYIQVSDPPPLTTSLTLYSAPGVVYPPESQPFSVIADSIRLRLATVCGIDKSFVLPAASDDYDITILEDFFLYYQFFDVDEFTDTGGGRLNPWATRRFRVYVYSRSGVDAYGEDTSALLGQYANGPVADTTLPQGHFAAEELVLDALFNWMPLSSTGLPLCTEPVHPLPLGGPPIRKAEDSEGLLRSVLDFSIRYGLWITKADPPN